MRSEIIKPVKKVRGGISVSHEKHTKDMQVKRIPAPETVTLPMSQHIGAPCTPTVKVGDRVLVGQVVGDTDKYVSAPVHASVSGKVTAVKEIRTAQGIVSQAVIIENDGLMEEAEFTPPKVETHDDLIKAVRASGAVGLGGAGFPTHVKLNFPQDGSVDTLIINAAECEPYITVDYRECLDNSWDVMSGVHLLKDMLNIKKFIIAVEDNKPDAIALMEEKVAPYDNIRVCAAKTQYPEGAEKMLIKKVMGRHVPSGKLPADVGCVVSNASTAKAVSDAIQKGMPFIERAVSVTGEFIRTPGNYMNKMGTSVQVIIDHCGGITGDDVVLKMGGPMMGAPIKDTNVPIIKGSNGIIAIAADHTEEKECIKCGRCVDVCPMELQPLEIYKYGQLGDTDALLKLNVMDCFSCKSRDYICSSKIPLVSKINAAKGLVMPLLKKK